jgi:hypothetical protein
MSENSKPVQAADEDNTEYRLRLVAWRRREAKRKREMANATDSTAEAAEPEKEPEEESLRDTVSKWFNRSERELKDAEE